MLRAILSPGAVVEIYQTVDAWQLPCPNRGRCPIAPVLAVVADVRHLRCEWSGDDHSS